MKSRIIALLTIALPGTAWAHTGHIADLGQGHNHWMVYWIGAGIVLGLAIWASSKLATRRQNIRRRK